MKAENFPSRLAMPVPFANDSDALATILDSQDSSGQAVNFRDGFPPAYSTPKSNGGKLVTRGEINALGNLASRNDYYRMCGGLNTFNQEFAKKIGGYAKGAVLQIFDGNVVKNVVSLVDDNLVDYTSPVEVIDGIIAGSVDGINWAFCDHEIASDPILLCSAETGIVNALNTENSTTVLWAGRLDRGGYIYPDIKWGDVDYGNVATLGWGVSITLSYKTPTMTEFSPAKYIASTSIGSTGAIYDPTFLPAGTILSVCLIVSYAKLSESTIKIYLN